MLTLPRIHVHRFRTVFTRQRNRVRYLECACGQRKARASYKARIERPLPDWPDPFARRRRERKLKSRTQTYGTGF